jgi:hypothetical protein
MKLTDKTTRCRQCLLCGALFTKQQSQNKHCLRDHKRKSKKGVSWDYVKVKTIIIK